MPKIAFIGAGSFGFTRQLVRDILTFPLLEGSTIALMDINKERLSFSERACKKIVALGKYPARVVATTDRREALKGADAVLVTILAGTVNIWQHDILIPKKYGIDICVGDTRGPSGIFRALRTIPMMMDICRDMEELCPDAILLNYTNPMAMLCHAMQRTSPLVVSGLCHSVQHTAEMLAEWAGVKSRELDFLCAGLNHLAWYLKLEHKGRDLYPRIRRRVLSDKTIYNTEQVRNEIFLNLGYYVSESSGHNSEYSWWFRKRPDLVRKYCTTGTGWNPGKHAAILDHYRRRVHVWKKQIKAWLADEAPISLERGVEYAAFIINAWLGGEIYPFNGNVPNTGLITNLPQGCCVEVPVLARRRRLQPIYVGALPPQCLGLTHLTANLEMMAVEGSLAGDAELVFQAVAHDPLTAARLSLAEARKMTGEMLRKNQKYLPQFKKIRL
ncbi:MAG: alpha-galactosidase [Planctomycetota bacterium]